jgi:cytochrome c peroxidase
LGQNRTAGIGKDKIKKRIPRNAPGLWNLGSKEITTLLHDGRISVSNLFDNDFNTPAEEWLPKGLDNILAAQALFPMTRQFEMAGNPGENEIIGLSHRRIDTVWPVITNRIRAIPEYVELFIEAFDDVDSSLDIDITHIANSISAFEIHEWTSYDSPFDDYINGNKETLTLDQIKGMKLFYGKANCSSCHSGSLFTNQEFYSIAIPQFGPGRTRKFDPYARDVGRMGETDDINDMYKFKTPSLRNVTLTGPYGHNGAYPTIEGIIRHHLNPIKMYNNWRPEMANLPKAEWLEQIDFVTFSDKREQERILSRIDIKPLELSDQEINYLVQFLNSLTGKSENNRPLGKPKKVPSGLVID